MIDNYDNLHSIDEEYLQQNFEKVEDIIGYKLIKPEYRGAALTISGTVGNWENSNKSYDISISQKGYIKDLTEAGVLNLWFEPVKEEEFKVGDIVTTKGSNPYLSIRPNITEIVEIEGDAIWCKDFEGKSNLPKSKFKELYKGVTKEDFIEEAKNRKLLSKGTTIIDIYGNPIKWAKNCWLFNWDGNTFSVHGRAVYSDGKWAELRTELPPILDYKAEDTGSYLKWGCFSILKSDIEKLIELGLKSFVIKASGETATVTEEEFKQIKNYLKQTNK